MASEGWASADVVVVGAGAIGCSVAYHLARAGADVVVLERFAIGGGASSANPGVISLVTKSPGRPLRLAMLSVGRFATLGDEVDADIEYERCGVLIVAENDQEMEFLADLSRRQRAQGAPIETLDATEARELNSLLSDVVVGGTYCAADAHINPIALTRAYAAAAARRGATLVEHARPLSVTVSNGTITRIATDRGDIRTRWLVNCAGADAPSVGELIGVRHDVVPRLGQMIVLRANIDLPPTKVVTARQLLAKHLGNFEAGGLSFGYTRKTRSQSVILGTTNEDPRSPLSPVEVREQIFAYARRLMPRLLNLSLDHTTSGLRPFSLSGPIIGPTDGPNGYLAATGHGGDGMSLSAITGEFIADLVTGSSGATSLDEFIAMREAEQRATI